MVNPYSSTINYLIPRVLSMVNRNPLSSTYGCFDRNFWHYKTIIDFPSATYQQAVLGLATLFSIRAKGNIFYQQPRIGEFIKAGILYWCKIQKNDGSFNEYYENEHSFCATAFTTFAIAQGYNLCQNLFTIQEKIIIKNSLLKSSQWLVRHNNFTVGNQMIASMIALFWVARITQSAFVKKSFKKRRLEILKLQNKEGWFPEYGSADLGYSFLSLDLFSYYLAIIKDKKIIAATSKLLKFVINFLHPDGTCGGNYGSRSSQHVFPFCLEFLSNYGNKSAQDARKWFKENFNKHKVIHPSMIDDKYALYFYFLSYVKAFLTYKDNHYLMDKYNFPHQRLHRFKNAGLLCLHIKDLSAWFNYEKNGVCQIFNKNNLIYADCGYLIQLSNKNLCASQVRNKNIKIEHFFKNNNFYFKTIGNFGKIDDSLPLTKWLLPFKLFCKTLLKQESFSYWFNKRLKFAKISKQNNLPITIIRKFIFNEEKLIINDQLKIQPSYHQKFKLVKLIHDFTIEHSPSSRYFQKQFMLPKYKRKLIRETPKECQYEYEISLDRK